MGLTELEAGILMGRQQALSTALNLLRDDEWHDLSKNYSSTTEDLHHDPEYCWACQVSTLLVKEINNG
jgi:hypothetical protein